MVFEREIFQKIEKYLESPETIVLTGMRRTGKTTTLRHFFNKIGSSNKLFLDLENPLNQAVFANDNYEAIKSELAQQGVDLETKSYVFLDEIQFVKNAPSVIKYFYDHYKVKFFVSGSASFYLKNLFSESLAGRKFVFELFPLNFNEFLLFKRSGLEPVSPELKVTETIYERYSPLFNEYIEFGGYPQVVLKNNIEEKVNALEDIFVSYYQKEVLHLGDFKKNSKVRQLVLLLAERVGQKLDVQKLSLELKVSRPTIYNYLDFLEGTYLIKLVNALGKADVPVRKQSKLYFADCGLLNAVNDVPTGNLFENNVFNQLQGAGEVNYYQEDGKEIDFITHDIGFEVKQYATRKDLNKLKARAGKRGLSSCYCISRRYSEIDNVLFGFQDYRKLWEE